MSLFKLAAPGSGFARLQAIGLGEKALAKYHGSDWLKNAPAKVIPKLPVKETPGIVSKTFYDQALKRRVE